MKSYQPYINFVVFLVVVYICFLIAKPFLPAIFTGMILAYLFFPIYGFFCRNIKGNTVVWLRKEVVISVIITILVLALLLVPSVFIVQKLTDETVLVYSYVRSRDFSLLVSNVVGYDVSEYVKQSVDRGLYYILKLGSDFVLTIPKFLLNFFVALFVMYFFLIDGQRLIERIKDTLPMDAKGKNQIFSRFKKTTDALMYGNLVVALIQGGLALIGFLIFGISGAFLWGIITVIVSFLPVLGTAIVWLPLGLVQLAKGDMFSGLGIIIYGGLVISTIDNLIRPKLVSSRADIHPIIILVGVLGGISLMGFIGFIVGPLILALLLEFFDIYGEKNEIKS